MNLLRQRINVFFKYRPLLFELVKRDIKVRYRHSFLGMIWTVLNPLLMMVILSIVFSSMFKMDISNFPVYVLIGQIIFSYNTESTTQGMNSIVWNSSLIKKVYIPKYLFSLSNCVSSLVNFGFSFIALIIVMIFTHAEFHPTLLTMWIPLLYLTVFSFGLSLILCSINVFFRDMQHLYGVFTTAWMYLSAIFYAVEILPTHLMPVVEWNPLYRYITFFRQIILQGTFPSLEENIICIMFSIGTLILGVFTFLKAQDKFILHI